MKQAKSQVTVNIDFESNGRNTGTLEFPHSVHESAYGRVIIPIASIKNGSGPTALLMAGNHGDEFEGQIVLSRLVRELDISAVQGRVIILPMANYPACSAGLRTSPLDNGNLNRCFPGDENGTPTEKIAHFIEHTLMPVSDFALDLHCGGSSVAFLTSTIIVGGQETQGFNERLELATAFGVKQTIVYEVGGDVKHLGSTAPSAALRTGIPLLAAEVGYGGTTSPGTISVCKEGVLNVLKQKGVVNADPPENPCPMVLNSSSEAQFVYSKQAGLFEPNCVLGDSVKKGDVGGWLHSKEFLGKSPKEVIFPSSGIVINIGFRTMTKRGDILFRLASEVALS